MGGLVDVALDVIEKYKTRSDESGIFIAVNTN